jgi:predicted phosphoserine aminotransferase
VSDHPVLFIPGPTEVDEELRRILAMPLIGHRDKALKAVVVDVCRRLAPFVGSARPCYVENAPATGIMEAAIRNLVHRRTLHLTCGAFGERWVKATRACGREPTEIAVAWGEANTTERLRDALREADEPYEAVCLTHSETSTGVLNDVAALAAVVREESPDSLVLVDTVTSAFGARLDFDAWGLDLVFAGTQKCLALPPGLAFYAVSERALEKARGVEGRGWWLDFVANVERFEQGATPATPCVPLFFALQRQIDRMETEGIERRLARHRAMQQRTIEWASDRGITPFVADAASRSPTVSALNSEGHDVDAMIARARDAGFTVGKGYGKLKETTFRIGHMGDHTEERLERLLQALTP